MAKDLLKVNGERMLSDLLGMGNYLVNDASYDTLKYEMNNFGVLNECAEELYGLRCDISYALGMDPNIPEVLAKKRMQDTQKFYGEMLRNKELFCAIYGNYLKMLEEIDFKDVPFYSKVRGFNKKDFRDTILGFYSQFGNNIYAAAKKYFDEDRIEMGYSNKDGFAGFFVGLRTFESGYIMSCQNKYNSWTASIIAHELGHAVDAETFLFPQQKALGVSEDIMLEVPSVCFEGLFNQYLFNSGIDYEGGLIIDNCMKRGLEKYSKNFIEAAKKKEMKINVYGELIDDEEETNEENTSEEQTPQEEKEFINIRHAVIYGLGDIMAFHFIELFKNNPKEFVRIYNNVITSRKENDIEKTIELLGMSVDDFASCKYIRQTIQDDNMKLRKRFNYYA